MKPGVSVASTVVLPHASTRARAAAVTAALVERADTISTSGITGAGLKKCTPTTRSGCVAADASDATDSDDVFVARIASGATTPASAANSARFTARSSTTASITTPHSLYMTGAPA